MNNIDRYQNIFIDVFGVESSKLNDQFSFDKIDTWNSFTHLTLISKLESEFNIIFETDDILSFGSYLNGIKILKKYGVDLN